MVDRSADRLAELLTATAGELARRSQRRESTAVPQEQAELGRALMMLHRWLPGFVARIVPGNVRYGEWSRLATVLETLAAECHRQDQRDIVIDGGY